MKYRFVVQLILKSKIWNPQPQFMQEGLFKWVAPLILIAIVWILYFLEMYLTIYGAIAFSAVIIILSGTYLWGWEWEDD